MLGPVVGARSVLLLDGAEHMRQRKLLLPPFHGERMRAYEQTMRDAADRAIDSWPVGRDFTLLPSMQALTLDVIARAVFGVAEGPRQEELKRRIRELHRARWTSQLSILLMVVLPAAAAAPASGARFEEDRRRGRRPDLRGDRPAPRGARPGGARGRALDAAAAPATRTATR